MSSWKLRTALTAVALVLAYGLAVAGPEGGSSGSPPTATTGVQSETKESTSARADKSAEATAATKVQQSAEAKGSVGAPVAVESNARIEGSATADVKLQAIKDRARKAPAKLCADTEKKLEATVRAIDAEATANGDATVSGRIAEEFRITTEAILAERSRFQTGLGELVVAHTLHANAKQGVTIDQLFEMRGEGMGWSQIAYGLGLKQKSVASAVRAEGRVMTGLSEPDGSPARIASVETRAAAGVQAGTNAGATPTDAATGVDVGASIRGTVGK